MDLSEIFVRAMSSRIFRSREKLLPDYIPGVLPHRNAEIAKIASILAPALRGERPDSMLVYGPVGAGKTAVVRYVLLHLEAAALGRNVRIAYVNARRSGALHKVLVDIAEAMGIPVPLTGLSVGEIFARITKKMSETRNVYIVAIDEVDFLVKRKEDIVLHKLTKISSELRGSKLSLIGIMDSPNLIESLDPGLKGGFGEVEVVFKPYDADQLKDILAVRAAEAFNEGSLENDVIPLCSALAVKDRGHARRALDLLRVAGEIAERSGSDKVTGDHVLAARKEIEKNKVAETVRALSLHGKLVLLAIAIISNEKNHVATGEVYEKYRDLTRSLSLEAVTMRRVSGILTELDMLGVISGKVISKGRYGKTRVIELRADPEVIAGALREDVTVGELIEAMKPKRPPFLNLDLADRPRVHHDFFERLGF